MKSIILVGAVAAVLAGYKQFNSESSAFQVDKAASKIEWYGATPDHSHIGSFDVTGGIDLSSEGRVKGGEFTIPVASIVDYDLPDPVRQTLLEDLKSANFFNMVKYPETKFKITKVGAYGGVDTSYVADANYLLTGDFTMLGQTHSITFPAHIRTVNDSLVTDAKFNLDRTKWGMKMYSDPKQKLYIYPNVKISLHVKAAKTAKGETAKL
ncbi:YceI family protein [Dyadobacter luticola]|uniref:YceI family protein n=1 Tax=Dyadobacter luticola TaxID=1979387 RepID=A0A5R9KW85_9BACT|nr:YceI family protein [Dyadobacter luticola]TLV00428.1 YceI family protein [Dyadobacter luticola]